MNNNAIIDAIVSELYNLSTDDLVDINNDYVNSTGNGTAIFSMDLFDDEFRWYSSKEMFELGQENTYFDFANDYFIKDEWNDGLESFDDPEFEFTELAKWMLENDEWYDIDVTEIKKKIKKQELADEIEVMLTDIIEDNLATELGVELVNDEQFDVESLNIARAAYIGALIKNFKIEMGE